MNAARSKTSEIRRDIERLAAIDRPSGSDGGRRAADWIASRLREAGLEAQAEQERVHPTFWWPIGLLNAAAVVAAALPKRATWNVWAEHGDPSARATVVVVAHHDAAHGGAIYDTRAIEALARR